MTNPRRGTSAGVRDEQQSHQASSSLILPSDPNIDVDRFCACSTLGVPQLRVMGECVDPTCAARGCAA